MSDFNFAQQFYWQGEDEKKKSKGGEMMASTAITSSVGASSPRVSSAAASTSSRCRNRPMLIRSRCRTRRTRAVDAGIERGAQGDHGTKILAEERVTLDALVEETRKMGSETGLNVVAFSGGVDSSLVAYLVHRAFPRGRAAACIGISESLSARQLATAREVASEMGFKLLEVETREIEDERYARNTGDACLYCKRALYGTIEAVAVRAKEELALAVERRKQMRENRFTSKFTRIFAGRGKNGGADGSNPPMSTVDAHGDGDVVMTDLKLFNGTNRDDLKDLTRLGIAAAAEFNVQSPLCNISKADVRRLALVRPMLGTSIDRGERIRTSDMLYSPPHNRSLFLRHFAARAC